MSVTKAYINIVSEALGDLGYEKGVNITIDSDGKEIFLTAVTVAEFLELAGDAPVAKRDRGCDIYPIELSFMLNGVKVIAIFSEWEMKNEEQLV